MGRYGSLIFLLGLGASAGTAPQHLGPLLQQVQSFVNSPQVVGGDDQMDKLLQEATQGRPGGGPSAQELPPETRQMLAELTPQADVIKTPLMEALLKASQPRARTAGSGVLSGGSPAGLGALSNAASHASLDVFKYVATIKRVYEENQATLIGVLWGAPIGLLGLAALLSAAGARGVGRVLAQACHALSRKWLLFVSLTSASVFAYFHVNLWTTLPSDLWSVAIGALLASAALLRALDMNYPVWNSILMGLLAPLFSCAAILGWPAVAGLLRGIKA